MPPLRAMSTKWLMLTLAVMLVLSFMLLATGARALDREAMTALGGTPHKPAFQCQCI